jgi:hypothetical protein
MLLLAIYAVMLDFVRYYAVGDAVGSGSSIELERELKKCGLISYAAVVQLLALRYRH